MNKIINKLRLCLFSITEETIVLYTDDMYYPNKAIGIIINRCLIDDIDIIKIKHTYRYESIKKELISVDITLRVTRKRKNTLDYLHKILLSDKVHMDIKEY